MTAHRAPTPNPALNTWSLPASLHDRLQREHGWTAPFLSGAEREYRRFVYLATQGQGVTPSQSVDEVWHAHILFTRDYAAFQAVLPAPLHHEPGTGGPGDDDHFREQYARTLAEYALTFGEAAPDTYWPRPVAAMTPATSVRHQPQTWMGLLGAFIFLTFLMGWPLLSGLGVIALLALGARGASLTLAGDGVDGDSSDGGSSCGSGCGGGCGS
ncbi:hypothetical protein K7W42_04790 [Deinococcus sp. HMF7604]|uniref:glycine-rich domain-containing protein n=1 Tax=Deinococcus betulae TaxID=2873312 RepID=UPI001CCF9EB2|nr:hypothetical protein [Deinococcus betulae]MBZ9750175.1 hypothetical protein [Deinococcus betulae]